MPPRQRWFFRFGCWSAFAVAVVHLVGLVAGPAAPVNDIERQIMTLATTYRFHLPGGSARSVMDFMNGFSLAFAVLMVTIGAAGLAVDRRAHANPEVMYPLARVLALSTAALL